MGLPDDPHLAPLIVRRIRPNSTVLHLGCQAGDLMLALEAQLRCETMGIEPDPAQAAVAQEKGLAVVVADVGDAPLTELVTSLRFDTVVITGVLERLADPAGLLGQLPGVLRKQGSAIVAFPNATHVDFQLSMAQGDWPDGSSYSGATRLMSRFSLRSFSEMAVRAGLEVLGHWPIEDSAPGALVFSRDLPLLLDNHQVQAVMEANRGNPGALVRAYVVELVPTGGASEQLAPGPPRRAARGRPRADGELEAIVVTTGTQPHQLKEALYSLAALSEVKVRAVVVVETDRADAVGQVRGLLQHFAGLLPVSVELSAGGRGSAFNVGLQKLEGRYGVFMTDQDVLYPTFAHVLMPSLRADGSLSAAYGRGRIVLGSITESGFSAQGYGDERGEPFDRMRLFVDDYVSLSACLVRLNVLRSLGVQFSEAPGVEVGWALLCQLAALSDLRYVPEAVAESRLSSTSGPDRLGEQALAVARTRRVVLEGLAGRPVRMSGGELAGIADRLGAALAEATERRLEGQLEESQLLLSRLLQSRSWKLTRPLRRISRSNLPD